MAMAGQQQQVVSAARFVIEFSQPMGQIAFSELAGISSKVGSQEYIYNDDQGNTIHTKQFGKTEPPTVTLKRGLDSEGSKLIMNWHKVARNGDQSARQDGKLKVMGGDGKNQVIYLLHNAWCSEVTISGMKAGSSDVATIEVKLTCEEITVL
jgi:phage tail-like protein